MLHILVRICTVARVRLSPKLVRLMETESWLENLCFACFTIFRNIFFLINVRLYVGFEVITAVVSFF
jgi:hypothetical protein